MTDIEVKITSERKIETPYRRFAGMQGDTGYRLKFDVKDIYSDDSIYRVEWYGAADSFTQTILLDVSDGMVYANVPTDIVKAGGTATAYLIEEKVVDDEVVERVCTYPIRLYLGNKPTGDNSVAVGEYERNVTDMYLAVVNAKQKQDEQAKKASDAFKTATAQAEKARQDYEAVADNIQENKAGIESIKTDIDRIDGNLSGHSRSISEHSEKLDTLENRAGEHEVSAEAHSDIRLFIKELQTKVNTLLDSDDTTLDQMSEIVAYIKANKELIESVTTAKVNVDDIIDNLTTNVSNKPLSAAQGVMLKSLIDAITVPTKLSELNDDVGYATKEDIENKQDKFSLNMNEALEFVVGENGEIILRIKSGNEISQDENGLFVNNGYGLRHNYNSGILEIDTDVIAKKSIIKDSLDSVLETNSEYYLGDVSADTALSFPSTAEIGDTIYVNFNCASQFALTIDMTNTSDIDIDIEEGVSYEIFASWNGSVWILGYNEYTVS